MKWIIMYILLILTACTGPQPTTHNYENDGASEGPHAMKNAQDAIYRRNE